MFVLLLIIANSFKSVLLFAIDPTSNRFKNLVPYARLMSLYPLLYSAILANQQQAAKANQLRSEGLYLELVQFMTNALPQRLIDIVQKQLLHLNTMNIKAVGEGATLQLEGDQYRAYTAVTNSITNSRHTGVHFFVTGPGGTGKSFLLKSLEMWCHRLRQKPLSAFVSYRNCR